jgi:HSP20 family protein
MSHVQRRRQHNANIDALWSALWVPERSVSGWISHLFSDQQDREARCIPAADICDTKEAVVISVDLPGVQQQHVQVSVEENTLTIKGERSINTDHRQEGVAYVERAHGSFQRTYTLPQTVDVSLVKAVYVDGVLRVTLPKRQEAQARQITIDAA